MAKLTDDDLAEARRRYDRAGSAWSEHRTNFDIDMGYVSGTEQWNDADIKKRKEHDRPYLTFNQLGTRVDGIVNNAKQNARAIKVSPVTDANEDGAKVNQGLIRHFEYACRAETARYNAQYYAVAGGWGFYRMRWDYEPGEGFNKTLKIEWIMDPNSVRPDPDSQQPDFSDMKWCFVDGKKIGWDEYRRRFPNASVQGFSAADKNENPGWSDKDGIMLAEYWHVETTEKRYVKLARGEEGYAADLKFDEKEVEEERQVPQITVYQDLINGVESLQQTEWITDEIPIFVLVGKQQIAKGKRIFEGIVRQARDAQRMVNAYGTGEAEAIGLNNRVPVVGMKGQFDSDPNWESANKTNPPFLTFDAVELPDGSWYVERPERQYTEAAIQSLSSAKAQALDDLNRAVGYFDNLPTPSQQRDLSGVAEDRRTDQSNVTNFHFSDNLELTMWREGKMWLKALPRVIDTPRAMRIMDQDGKISMAAITMALAEDDEGNEDVPEVPGFEGKPHHRIDQGEYDVVILSGPDSQTKRREAAQYWTNFAGTPVGQMVGSVGADIIVRNLDEEGADELSKRCRAIPSVAQAIQITDGQGQPGPEQIQQMVQENQLLKAELQKIQIDRTGQIAKTQIQTQSQERIHDQDNAVKIIVADIAAKNDAMIETMQQRFQAIENMLETTRQMIVQQHAAHVAADPSLQPPAPRIDPNNLIQQPAQPAAQ